MFMELPSQRVMDTEGGHLPSSAAMQLSHREGSSTFLVVSAGKQQGWVGEWESWEPAEFSRARGVTAESMSVWGHMTSTPSGFQENLAQ